MAIGQVFVEHLGVEANHLFGGEGVEIAADRIDRTRDVFGRPVGRAFEEHVLDEVREAVFFGGFAAGTARNPNPDRKRNGHAASLP